MRYKTLSRAAFENMDMNALNCTVNLSWYSLTKLLSCALKLIFQVAPAVNSFETKCLCQKTVASRIELNTGTPQIRKTG